MPAELIGNVGDAADAYYQFNIDNLAEWFGLDDPVTAAEVGVSQVWDQSFDDAVEALEDAGFVLHELDRGGVANGHCWHCYLEAYAGT